MTHAEKLFCLSPATPPRLELRACAMAKPGKGQALVRVAATSVNPIDVKRAGGYGRRLLGLKGAARFPLVLGNDLVGVVESVGPGVSSWRPGDRVFGLVPTGRNGGAHATHVAVDAKLLRPAPMHVPDTSLAALPYNFTTLWLALRGAAIAPPDVKGRRILIHGASGGLGQMAVRLLTLWGASVTAICSTANMALCQSLGAEEVWDRNFYPLDLLPSRFDHSLNFASWDDEPLLLRALRQGAFGHATVVHPLLHNFDHHGWIGGTLRTRRALSRMKALAAGKGAAYRWIVFKPDVEALDVLCSFLSGQSLSLPIAMSVSLKEAERAFTHVAEGKGGRAILLPQVHV